MAHHIDDDDDDESKYKTSVGPCLERSARQCASFLPVLFVIGLVGWTYYTVVVLFWVPFISKGAANVIIGLIGLIIYHLVFILFIICYLRTIFTDPGTIPEDIEEQHSENMIEVKYSGDRRFCSKCRKPKPDRSHHCSICNKCVRKMDHHCPWVANCVGWKNYKFFILFLTYTVLLSLVVTVTLVDHIIGVVFIRRSTKPLESSDIQLVVTFLVAVVFGLGLFFFAAAHYRLVLRNMSTIESFEKRRRIRTNVPGDFRTVNENPYDIGSLKNFKQVMGPSWFLAFLPVANQMGNGIIFPTKYDGASEKHTLLT